MNAELKIKPQNNKSFGFLKKFLYKAISFFFFIGLLTGLLALFIKGEHLWAVSFGCLGVSFIISVSYRAVRKF